MTPAQLNTLKVLASADQTAAGFIATADDQALADWFNTPDVAFFVWRTNVRIDECNKVMVWTEIDALTNGKARIWDWMSRMGVLDASQANVRQGLTDAFSAATNTRTALTALAKRNATRAEKALIASGTGSNASPAIMGHEGTLSAAAASQVRVA